MNGGWRNATVYTGGKTNDELVASHISNVRLCNRLCSYRPLPQFIHHEFHQSLNWSFPYLYTGCPDSLMSSHPSLPFWQWTYREDLKERDRWPNRWPKDEQIDHFSLKILHLIDCLAGFPPFHRVAGKTHILLASVWFNYYISLLFSYREGKNGEE